MAEKIFVTYLPGSDIGKSTALRMQTIAHLYGFEVLTPYRINHTNLTVETKERIKKSRFVLGFFVPENGEHVDKKNVFFKEIQFANTKNIESFVLVQEKDKSSAHQLFDSLKNVKIIDFDYLNPDDALDKLSDYLNELFKKPANNKMNKPQKNSDNNIEKALAYALISMALGLLVYWFLSSLEEDLN